MIVFETFADEKIPEGSAQVVVSRLVSKLERADMIEIDCELLWKTIAEFFGTDCLFHLPDEH